MGAGDRSAGGLDDAGTCSWTRAPSSGDRRTSTERCVLRALLEQRRSTCVISPTAALFYRPESPAQGLRRQAQPAARAGAPHPAERPHAGRVAGDLHTQFRARGQRGAAIGAAESVPHEPVLGALRRLVRPRGRAAAGSRGPRATHTQARQRALRRATQTTQTGNGRRRGFRGDESRCDGNSSTTGPASRVTEKLPCIGRQRGVVTLGRTPRARRKKCRTPNLIFSII